MKHLLVCGVPGDEVLLYGHLVATALADEFDAVLLDPCPLPGEGLAEAEDRWSKSCRFLGITPSRSLRSPIPVMLDASARRDVTAARVALSPPHDLLDAFSPLVHAVDRIYVPDVQDPCISRAFGAALLSALSPIVWMAASYGPAEQIAALDARQFEQLCECLSKHYSEHLRTSRISVSDLKGVQQYRRFEGPQLRRFVLQWLGWQFASIREEDPWDFNRSPYEGRRHSLECRVLHEIEWASLVEIGACQGAFTRRLLEEFPGRKISCVEPDPIFAETLRQTIGHAVEVDDTPVERMTGTFDVVLASSVLYYVDTFPLSVLNAARQYFVSSHVQRYHDTVVTPILTRSGWTQVARHIMAPCVEMFCNIPVQKDGAEVAIWRRPGEEKAP